MYLSELKLWNFRKYGNGEHLHSIPNDTKPNLVVEFKPNLNVLIGENDSGKTAIIDAIKLVLNTKSLENSRIEDKDFYKPSTDKEQNRSTVLRIECKFKALNPAEAGSFLEWVGFDEKNEYELTVWLTATRTKENRIITNIKAGADDEGIQLDGEARENLKVTYLKPLRDALSELTPGYKSRLAQILGGHDVFKAKSNDNPEEKWEHELERKAKEANNIIRNYFKPTVSNKTLKTIEEIQEQLNVFSIYLSQEKGKLQEGDFDEIISRFSSTLELLKDNSNKENDGSQITDDIYSNLKALSFEGSVANPAIEITDDELSDILKTLKLVNDSNKAGLGSLNKLYMAAEFLLLKRSKGRELQLALIEEIEAHLHPQAQLKVIDALQNNENLKKGQLILTTHSTTLASKVKLDNLILCHGDNVYPMFEDGNHTKLENGDYKFLERFLDATKANLFFARGVIMVEGDAENLLIPTIAKIIGHPLHDYGVSIVNVGSTAFMRYAKIFQRGDDKTLNIPVACITDLDVPSIEYWNDKKTDVNPTPKKFIIQDSDIDALNSITDEIDWSGMLGMIISSKSEFSEKYRYYKKDNTQKLSNGTPALLEEYYLKNENDITSQLITQIRQQKKLRLEQKIDCQNVKGFIPDLWTLEYDIAFSGLFIYLEKASQMAKFLDANNSNILSDGLTKKIEEEVDRENLVKGEETAYKIFKPLNEGTVKKPTTAQCLSLLFERDEAIVKSILLADERFKYIREAIYHATKQPEI